VTTPAVRAASMQGSARRTPRTYFCSASCTASIAWRTSGMECPHHVAPMIACSRPAALVLLLLLLCCCCLLIATSSMLRLPLSPLPPAAWARLGPPSTRFDDLGSYANERSLWLAALRNAVEAAWQAWEADQLPFRAQELQQVRAVRTHAVQWPGLPWPKYTCSATG